MKDYYKYDPTTFDYRGAMTADSQPENTTAVCPVGLIGRIIFNPASNQWTGDSLDTLQAHQNISTPSADQLIVMGLTHQIATLNSEVAEMKATPSEESAQSQAASAPSEENTQSQAASAPTSQASSASEGSAN